MHYSLKHSTMRIFTVALLFLTSAMVLSYKADRANNNFAHETADCSDYFMVTSGVPQFDETTVNGL
jgi:hypothetical protein